MSRESRVHRVVQPESVAAFLADLDEWLTSRQRTEWSGSPGTTAKQGYDSAVEEVVAMWNYRQMSDVVEPSR